MRIDDALFDRLHTMGQVDEAQRMVLVEYYRNPYAAIWAFLKAHPEFVRRVLHGSDARTAQRARLLITENPYGLSEALGQD